MWQQTLYTKHSRKARPRKFSIELTEKACYMLQASRRLDKNFRPIKRAESFGKFISRAIIHLLKFNPIDEGMKFKTPLQRAKEEKLETASKLNNIVVELQRLKEDLLTFKKKLPILKAEQAKLIKEMELRNKRYLKLLRASRMKDDANPK